MSDAAWSNATSAGVSGIGAMLLGAMVLLAAVAGKLDKTGAPHMGSIVVVWSLVAGLSVCHQHALALTAAPLTAYLFTLPSIRGSLNPSIATYALLALISGIVPHAMYMPMVAGGRFPGDSVWSHMLARGFTPWFHTHDASASTTGLYDHELMHTEEYNACSQQC